MLKRKSVRTGGKIKLSEYFKELKDGDRVAIVREHALQPRFPKRIQGRTGVVIGKRGEAYIIRLKDGNKEKIHIIKAVHLKKLKA